MNKKPSDIFKIEENEYWNILFLVLFQKGMYK